jgi:hypothetical protein
LRIGAVGGDLSWSCHDYGLAWRWRGIWGSGR